MLERIAAGRTDLVFDWIERGHPVDATVAGGGLLTWCAYYGDVSAIRFLLGNGAALVELGEGLGLNGAAFHGHWRLCEFLLEQGADPNRPLEDSGEVPLHAALNRFESLEHEQVVRVLLARGADPNRVTIDGAETGCFMRDCRTYGEAPLHRAAAFGTRGSIELLLAGGARVDQPDARGDSPLSWASWANRPTDILRLLCFGPHRIHPDHQPMRANLIGWPVAPAASITCSTPSAMAK